jgi:hypothetical protein
MTRIRPIAALLAGVVLATGAAGCGSDNKTSATTTAAATPPAPAGPGGKLPIPDSPTATFVFDAGALKPPTLRIPRTTSARLVLISADGRPHAAAITVGGKRQRLVIGPSGRGELQLQGLKPGHSYHVVPDGATDPVTLLVG